MDFDKFKNDWKREIEAGREINIKDEIAKLKSSRHPLDQLKRNMRYEFFAQVLALIFLGFLPIWCSFNQTLQIIFYLSYIIFALITIYYLATFYRFYKAIQQYTETTKKILRQIHSNLLLNMERYKAFGFVLIPFVITWLVLYVYDALLKKNRTLAYLTEDKIMLLFVIILVATILFMLSVVFWIKFYYGKYTDQIKAVLDELEEEN